MQLLGPHIVYPPELPRLPMAWAPDPLTSEVVYLIPSPNSRLNRAKWEQLARSRSWRWLRPSR